MAVMARWANGVPVTEDEATEVLMWYFGEDAKSARADLFCITKERLQEAVDYYLAKEDER